MSKHALIAKWDATIAQIVARADALLAEAVAASQPLIETIRTDLTPLVLPWNTIPPRIRALSEEVSSAWDRISDEMSECGEFSHDELQREGSKRDFATLELDLRHDRANGEIMARAAERMRGYAIVGDAAQHRCAQCGATLDRCAPVSQSLNVACGYCSAVNTVHPGDALRAFALVGASFLAAHAARDANEHMRRLECYVKQYRDAKQVPLAVLVELEQVTHHYWTVRLTTEAQHNPAEQAYVATKHERYMKDTYRTLRRFWQWREHEASRPA
jgi:hypothetical protein